MKNIIFSSITIVLATYNGTAYLRDQLSSVFAELLPSDELIIVDDASTDGTFELLECLKYPNVRVIRNLTNVGVVATFERGLLLSSNEIIFLCDQDDIWLPGKRASFLAAFALNPESLVVLSDAEIIDANGAVIAPSFMATRGGFRDGLLSTVVRNRYLGCAMALRRELLFAVLPISRTVPMHDMWIGALGSVLGGVTYIASPLIQYRRHGSNLSPSQRQGWLRMLRWRCMLIFAIGCRLVKLVYIGSYGRSEKN